MNAEQFTCSGLAVPYDRWIDADPLIDPPHTLSLRFRPGAFALALEKGPRSTITIDHIVQKDRMHVLSQPDGCTVEFWEQDDGLYFEARGIAPRLHALIKTGWIKHVCLEMVLTDGAQYPPGTSVEILQVPEIRDLALILFCKPHASGTSVKAGPAVDRRPVAFRALPTNRPDCTAHRVVARG